MDRDVVSGEGIGGDCRGEVEQEQRTEVGAALGGESGKDAATVVVEDLAELAAGVGQDAGGGGLVGLV